MPKQSDPMGGVKAQSGGGVTPWTLAYHAFVIKSPVMLSARPRTRPEKAEPPVRIQGTRGSGKVSGEVAAPTPNEGGRIGPDLTGPVHQSPLRAG